MPKSTDIGRANECTKGRGQFEQNKRLYFEVCRLRMKAASSKARVGLVIGQLSTGGAELQVTRLAVELSRRTGFTPVVFCLSSYIDPYGPELTKAGIEWHATPVNFKSWLAKLIWLTRQVRQTRCDLVYGFLHVGNIYAGAAALLLNLPFIASMRSANSDFSNRIKTLTRFFLNRANVIVSNSSSGLEILRQDFQIRHERIILIPNIIIPVSTSPEARRRLRQQWGVTDEPVIGTIAQIKAEKRTRLFVDTFTALNSHLPAHFVWVGDGPEKPTLETQAAALDPQIRGRLHLEGYQKDIAAYLSAFDLFILTSAYEGSPNALLEAMSAQKVCVATNAPGITEVFAAQVFGQAVGVLCDRQDPEKIAQSIADLWADKMLMQNLSQNAHHWIQTNFSTESILQTYGQLFISLLPSR